jgi:hypothetical protein
LRRVSAALRSAAGLQPDPQTAPAAPADQQQRPQEQQQQPTGSRRADNGGTSTSVYTPTAGDLPATQGQNPRTKR